MFLGFKYQRINASSQKYLADAVDQQVFTLIEGGSRESIPELFQHIIRDTSHDLLLDPKDIQIKDAAINSADALWRRNEYGVKQIIRAFMRQMEMIILLQIMAKIA